MKYEVLSSPRGSVVTVEEAKAQSVITESHDDRLIKRLLDSATDSAERYTNTFLRPRTVRLLIETFPATADLMLGAGPVRSVSSVNYVDTDEAEQILDSSEYSESLTGKYPFIRSEGWPSTSGKSANAVWVDMEVGYENPMSAPEEIRHAILVRVAELYKEREESVVGVPVASSLNTFKSLLSAHRRFLG